MKAESGVIVLLLAVLLVAPSWALKPAPVTKEAIAAAAAETAEAAAEVEPVVEPTAEEVEARTGFETRQTVLGHVQRGGTPTAFDRVLATRFGVAAIDAVHDDAFGQMVALQGGDIVRVPLSVAVGTLKTVDPSIYEVAKVFFAG